MRCRLFKSLLLFLFIPLLGLLSGCSSLLYYPSDRFFVNPARYDLQPEAVTLRSANGSRLAAWYFSADPALPSHPPKAVLVFFHGNGQNMTAHYQALIWILKKGYDFLIFDYQGYGISESKPSPKTTVEDGEAAVQWAYEKWKAAKVPIVIFGQSLGGAVGMETALRLKSKPEIPIKLVVADSTFASYRKAGQTVLSKHFLTWVFQPFAQVLLSDQYAPGDHVSDLSPTPLIVIHGDQDEAVDYTLGEDLYKRASEPKEFWRVAGGHHIDGFHDPAIRERFLKKLDEITRSP